MRIFAIFEGGGARGVSHVGALRALNDLELEPVGWAGASAGAIIATLGCVGYNARELVAEDGSAAIVKHLEESCRRADDMRRARLKPGDSFKALPSFSVATDLLGKGRWARLQIARSIARLCRSWQIKAAAAVAIFVWVIFFIRFIADLPGSPNIWVSLAVTLPVLALIFGLILLVGMADGRLSGISGIASLKHFRRSLNMVIVLKLRGWEALAADEVELVTFRALHDAGRPPLKIVATDISEQTIRVFSFETTPDVAVAEAVCGSICLPLVFKPWKLQGLNSTSFLLDGGLLSNLPVWVLDDERSLDPGARTLAFVLEPTEHKKPGAGILAAIRTVVFGSSVMDRRGVANLKIVTLPTELKLLDFDAEQESVRKAVELADKTTQREIKVGILDLEEAYRAACEAVRAYAVDVFERSDIFIQPTRCVRAAVLFPESSNPDGVCPATPKMLRVRFGAGYEESLDEGLEIPITGSIAGETWRTGQTSLHFATDASKTLLTDQNLPRNVALSGEEHKLRRRLIRSDMRWLMSVAIYRRDSRTKIPMGDPAFVVCVDGEGLLRQASEGLSEAALSSFAEIHAFLSDLMDNVVAATQIAPEVSPEE